MVRAPEGHEFESPPGTKLGWTVEDPWGQVVYIPSITFMLSFTMGAARGLVGSALACWMAGPSSNPGLAPQAKQKMKKKGRSLGEWIKNECTV